jgi:hypothetical protein
VRPAKINIERLPLTLARATRLYLEDLAKSGTHGNRATEVAKTFIEQGIRDAIQQGFLKIRNSDDESS